MIDCGSKFLELAASHRLEPAVFDVGSAKRAVNLGEHLVAEEPEQRHDSLSRFLRPSVLRGHVSAVKG
jgi:hypothetical protein